ncbi:MAG: hypothetical protein FGM37_10315, partial [Phycisphaerales bacterium]|nr:hypothetical protein [Phycisphaerales bacterium]
MRRSHPAIASIIMALALGACGSVNTTYTRTTPADTSIPAQTQVNDLLTQIFLKAGEVRMFPS